MARSLILAVGVVLWAVVAISMIYLYSIGHWIAPSVTLMVGAPMMAIRAYMWRRRSVAVTA